MGEKSESKVESRSGEDRVGASGHPSKPVDEREPEKR